MYWYSSNLRFQHYREEEATGNHLEVQDGTEDALEKFLLEDENSDSNEIPDEPTVTPSLLMFHDNIESPQSTFWTHSDDKTTGDAILVESQVK